MKHLVSVCVAASLLAACGQKQEAPPPADSQATATPSTPPAAEPEPAAGASAQVAATQGHNVTGSLTVSPMGEGVHFIGTLQGLPPNGEFGFHVHEKGDCSAPDASSAGAHLNPAGAVHGPQDGPHHAGDMPNVKSDAQGNAQINAHVNGLTIGDGGATDVIGKAVVVHEKADDYKTQPSGDSGARVACGVINAMGM
jgi:Cu-Zn family superoxide dismutase